MSTLHDLQAEIQEIAPEVARARGDSALALDFIRGTPNKAGINQVIEANRQRIGFLEERDQERQQQNETWFRKLDDRLDSIERRMVHPASEWLRTLAVCLLAACAIW